LSWREGIAREAPAELEPNAGPPRLLIDRRVSARGLLLAWAVLSLAGPAAAEPRTFTDREGRSITAEIVDTTSSVVRIRRDDGRLFEIAKSTLSTADLEYVAEWERQRDFAFGGIEVATRRARLESDRSNTKSSARHDEVWCYRITIKNGSRARLEGLTAEWRVFYIDDTAKAVRDKLPLKRLNGRTNLGVLEAGGSTEVETSTVRLQTVERKAGQGGGGSGKRKIEDSLEGVWVRVLRGSEVVAEYSSPGSLQKTEAW
jgi:hypothetical protein